MWIFEPTQLKVRVLLSSSSSNRCERLAFTRWLSSLRTKFSFCKESFESRVRSSSHWTPLIIFLSASTTFLRWVTFFSSSEQCNWAEGQVGVTTSSTSGKNNSDMMWNKWPSSLQWNVSWQSCRSGSSFQIEITWGNSWLTYSTCSTGFDWPGRTHKTFFNSKLLTICSSTRKNENVNDVFVSAG